MLENISLHQGISMVQRQDLRSCATRLQLVPELQHTVDDREWLGPYFGDPSSAPRRVVRGTDGLCVARVVCFPSVTETLHVH